MRALVTAAPTPVRRLVVDASAITDLGYSAARTLRELCDGLNDWGTTVIFARVEPGLREDMERHGILAVVGASRVVPTLRQGLALAARDGDDPGDPGRNRAPVHQR